MSVWSVGAIYVSAQSFTLLSPTTLTSISPSSGPVGTTVTLIGKSFSGASSVSFNGTHATSFTVVSDTSMTAVVPDGYYAEGQLKSAIVSQLVYAI